MIQYVYMTEKYNIPETHSLDSRMGPEDSRLEQEKNQKKRMKF